MTGRWNRDRVLWGVLTAAAAAFAAVLAADTLRTVVPLWSPLPWFDEWATPQLIQWWQDGQITAGEMLFSQHNEHRIVVPRLVFLADDVLFRGSGQLSLACIVAVQFLHAGVFAAVLASASPKAPERWAVAAVVLALMFGLRQAENFTSGFQLQFVAVFAGATLSFALLGLAVARGRDGGSVAPPLAASLGAAGLITFTMANGLAVGYLLAALALAARMRVRIVLVCAAWALVLTAAYLHGYEIVAHHGRAADVLLHPRPSLLYAAAYVGGVTTMANVDAAVAAGLAGVALTAWAAWRTLRPGMTRPASLAMLGVMLFVLATAAVTAWGRVELSALQALSRRYATGSATFWAAHLVYWWIDPPGRPLRFAGVALRRGWLGRTGVAAAAAALCVALAVAQGSAKPEVYALGFAHAEAADLLTLGLDDPVVVAGAAWSDEDVQRLLPTLKRNGLSIFATADAAGLGRPVAARGALGPPCAGEVAAASADPSLGADGVRVSGRALDAGRLVRRVLLADAGNGVVGLATGSVPGAPRGAWRGFAVAPAGAALTAYGLVDGGRLCRIGDARVAAAQASQPDAAP